MKNRYFLTLLLFVLVFGACKKDAEEKIEATRMKLVDKLEKLDVPEAMKNSSNSNAQQAVSYVDMVKGVADYFSWFEVPEGAVRSKSTDEVYFWTYNGVTVWETLSETSTSYKWTIEIDTGSGKIKAYESEEKKDGSYGVLKVFNESGSSAIYTYEWTFDSAGNGSIIWKDATESFVYDVTVNVNKSGEAKWTSNGDLFYHFSWNSDGSGSYYYYGDNGEVLLSESWTVNDL